MIDFEVVELIALGFGGLSVLGLTEIIKRWIKSIWPSIGSWSGYLISLLVSFGFTAYYFFKGPGFPGWIVFVSYSLSVWLTANGIFKAVRRY